MELRAAFYAMLRDDAITLRLSKVGLLSGPQAKEGPPRRRRAG